MRPNITEPRGTTVCLIACLAAIANATAAEAPTVPYPDDKSTGGWGYEHFDRNDQAGGLTDDERKKCATCHAKAPADHVFSRIRP